MYFSCCSSLSTIPPLKNANLTFFLSNSLTMSSIICLPNHNTRWHSFLFFKFKHCRKCNNSGHQHKKNICTFLYLLAKSKKLTDYLLFLLKTIETDRIEIITPEERGCQISIRVKNGNKELFDKITEKGVVADWREPDVIRVAPVPLYNSFSDVFNFYNILKVVI